MPPPPPQCWEWLLRDRRSGRPARPAPRGSRLAGPLRRPGQVSRAAGQAAGARSCTSLHRQKLFRPVSQQSRGPGWARGRACLWPNGTLLLGLVVVSPGDPGSLPGGGGC